MKKNFYLLVVLLTASFFSYSQDEIYGTWYKVNDGDGPSRERIVVTSDNLSVERLQDYGVETPYWEQDKVSPIEQVKVIEEGIQIIAYDKTQNLYKGGELAYDGSMEKLSFFQFRETFSDIDAVYEMLETNKYKQLLSKPYYLKSRTEQIASYPNLGALSKNQIVELFKYLLSLEPLVDEYLNENSTERHARMLAIRGIENMRDQKLIEMGFNPYAMTDTYYGDKFQDDPDLIKLNEQSKYFKLF